MKKLAHVILAAFIIAAATLTASAQSETRQVSGFNSLSSSGPFNVHVNINGTESLKIEASSDVMSLIETTVDNGTLKIKFKNHKDWNTGPGKIDIYVTAKSLAGLANAGSGAINVEGTVSGSDVSVILSGSGNIVSTVKSEKLHVMISGSGSVKLSGSGSETKISISGSGSLNGRELKTNTTNASIVGSGNAYVNAEKSVSASLVGSGNLVYSGNATIESNHTLGSGRVSKAN